MAYTLPKPRQTEVRAAEAVLAEALSPGTGPDGYYRALSEALLEAAAEAALAEGVRTCHQCGRRFTPTSPTRTLCAKACVRWRAREQKRRRRAGRDQGATVRGPDSPAWRGGEFFHEATGRYYVYRDGKYVLRARAVMEAHLGSKLDRREQVHHINHDRTDDRLENLEVLDIAEHTRRHWQERRLEAAADARLAEFIAITDREFDRALGEGRR